MRPEIDIARCRCPRCVAVRRIRLLSIVCVCITFACVGYLVFDFSRPRRVKIPHLALAPETLPHPDQSTPAIQVQLPQSPVSQQLTETTVAPSPHPAVPSVTATQPSSPIAQPIVTFSSIADNPISFRVEATAVWVPFVIGILPGSAGDLAAGPLPKPEADASPVPVLLTQSANTESSMPDNGKPDRKENAREETGAPSKPKELPAKRALAVADPAPLPKVLQPTPVANISLTQSQERARKTRERELARSSANLYSSVPTPPPRDPSADQPTEAAASAPPPSVDVPSPSKSVNRERKGDADVAGDLRRFAANYLRADEKEDVSDQERFYAGSVHFYGEGDLGWARIAAATHRYHQNAHQRRYIISQSASVRGPVDGGFWVIEQPFGWTKSDGTRVQTGRSVLRMRVIPIGHGDFKITSIEQVGR
jgi:hypothetical protein